MPSSLKKPLASATMIGAYSPMRSQPSCVTAVMDCAPADEAKRPITTRPVAAGRRLMDPMPAFLPSKPRFIGGANVVPGMAHCARPRRRSRHGELGAGQPPIGLAIALAGGLDHIRRK